MAAWPRIDPGRLLGSHVQRPRLVDFVNGEPSPARIASPAQALVGIVGNRVLRILPIRGPGERHVPGAGEAGEFVDMAAGLIEVHALAQTNHLGDPEVAAKLLLDVGPRELGVAVRIEQAFLGGQAGTLAVHMNGAALEHERGPVSVRSLDFQYLLRHFVVAVPRKVQTAPEAAPGIEGPIHAAAPPFGIDDEGRPTVAYP